MQSDRPSLGLDPPINVDELHCSFCGLAYAEADVMICGPDGSVAICDACIELCAEIVAESRAG